MYKLFDSDDDEYDCLPQLMAFANRLGTYVQASQNPLGLNANQLRGVLNAIASQVTSRRPTPSANSKFAGCTT